MARYDVKRELKQFYAPRNADWALVDVPAQRFIAIDGYGDPNTSADYARAVETLYTVAYTIKFTSKTALGRDFVVGPLEGLWWSARLHREYLAANNLRMSGHHHEIYLSDHRRTEPAKLKTILRQPVRTAN
jgi:hypothetical protein